jgi:hypothetical protein
MIRTVQGRGWLSLAGPCALLVPVVVAGCGPGEGKVSGQVLFKGNPLPGGTVTFSPVDTKYKPATGPIDENGRF